MKCFAVIAAAAIGLATGCADNKPAGVRASGSPANPAGTAVTTAPGVEAPKPATAASPTASMSTSPGSAVVNDRDPPDRIPASR
jgi:hypothetical protein